MEGGKDRIPLRPREALGCWVGGAYHRARALLGGWGGMSSSLGPLPFSGLGLLREAGSAMAVPPLPQNPPGPLGANPAMTGRGVLWEAVCHLSGKHNQWPSFAFVGSFPSSTRVCRVTLGKGHVGIRPPGFFFARILTSGRLLGRSRSSLHRTTCSCGFCALSFALS